jgi:hypothetical protein
MGELQFSQPLTVRQAHAPLVSLDRSVVDPRLMRALALFELKRASESQPILPLTEWFC